MAKKDLLDALADPERQISKSKGELNKIFWRVIDFYNIGARQMYDGLRNYVNDPMNCEQTTNRRTEERNNLISAMVRPSMTMYTWMRALKAIQIYRVEMDLRFYRGKERRKIEFSHTIDLHTVSDTDEAKEDGTTEDESGSV